MADFCSAPMAGYYAAVDMTTSPILDENLFWQKDDTRHQMREAHDVQRDEIFRDFYDKLARAEKSKDR